ncbi:MAG: bis(5'-nucleosyl)-tetraphosphatase [Rubripirellula sp.]
MVKEPKTEQVRAAGFLLMLQPSTEDPQSWEFLLMRHRDRWDLPKGHCEEGEDFLEAALRETEEETGIDTQSITVEPDFSYELTYMVKYKRWNNRVLEKQVRYYLGYLTEKPKLDLTEHESAQWFAWAPPHSIQVQTIDPLLEAVARHVCDA